MKTPGQINYEGYLRSCGGVSAVTGDKLPTWKNQSAEIKRHWEAGAEDVIKSFIERKSEDG